MSGFDLNGGGAVGSIVPANKDAEPEMARLLAVMTQMQEGQNMLTDILLKQKAEIDALKVEVRRLKARTDAPKRPGLFLPDGPRL